MVKNALQAQLLKAGLVDDKKAKKISKQAQHAKRTGTKTEADKVKQATLKAQAEKVARDQKLNQKKHQALEQKTLKANIIQMIKQHQIANTEGEVEYQFVDDTKIKKIYINQKFYDQLVAGHLVIARDDAGYALLPYPLAERINEKMQGFIITSNAPKQNSDNEDDPYAAYVIPDDLMW